jgi:hypothetical protein
MENYEELQKDLIEHKIYTAWQFIEYTQENIDIANYCVNIINEIIDKLEIKTDRWKEEMKTRFYDDTLKNGTKVKRLSIKQDDLPTYEIRVAGEKIDPWFLFDKLLRDFFQYSMNAFDSMSQIINAGLLANKEKKVDTVDIQRMIRIFNTKDWCKTSFPEMHQWIKKVNESKDFKYIEAVNNRTKHTANIANKLAMGILGSDNVTQIGPFFRKNEQHDRVELNEKLQKTNQFLFDIWDEFISVFKEEYKKDKFIENRRHSITGVRQQICEDDPKQNLSYAYIKVEDNFDAMPEKIYLLLLKEDDDQIYENECIFDNILVTGETNTDILGRYKKDQDIGNDNLLHYRTYVKDNSATGPQCLYEEQKKNIMYNVMSPIVNLELIKIEK